MLIEICLFQLDRCIFVAMFKLKKHGGKRTGAGRKPVPANEKKVPVWLMVRGVDIEALGGLQKVQEIGLAAVARALKRKLS